MNDTHKNLIRATAKKHAAEVRKVIADIEGCEHPRLRELFLGLVEHKIRGHRKGDPEIDAMEQILYSTFGGSDLLNLGWICWSIDGHRSHWDICLTDVSHWNAHPCGEVDPLAGERYVSGPKVFVALVDNYVRWAAATRLWGETRRSKLDDPESWSAPVAEFDDVFAATGCDSPEPFRMDYWEYRRVRLAYAERNAVRIFEEEARHIESNQAFIARFHERLAKWNETLTANDKLARIYQRVQAQLRKEEPNQ